MTSWATAAAASTAARASIANVEAAGTVRHTRRISGFGPFIRGIGVDAVDIERFRVALARTPSLYTGLFVAEELAYVAPKADQVPLLAARFAAREAVMKALGVGLGAFRFHDVWVRHTESGEPELMITGAAAALADAAGMRHWYLSLTHTDLVAVAYVVAS